MKLLYHLLFLAFIAGCANGSPPSAIERALYTVTTNYQTQVTPVAVIGSNSVVTATNYITNVFATYELHERPAVGTSISAGSAAASSFGAPWLVPILGLLGALYGAYAKWQNNKSDKRNAKADILNTVLSQGIETAREIMVLTSAPSVEKKFVESIKSDQVKAGVKPEAAKVASEQVDTGAAKDTAARVLTEPVSVVSNGP